RRPCRPPRIKSPCLRFAPPVSQNLFCRCNKYSISALSKLTLVSIGTIEFEDVEEERKLTLDALGMRPDYLKSLADFQDLYRTECAKANIDYVPMDTSVSFDKALMEYLLQRQKRF